MRYFVPAAAAALLMAGAALTASPAAAQPRQQMCLQQNMVNGWKVINDQTLIVTDRVNRQYQINLMRGCRDLKWPMRLGFQSGTGFGIGCIQRHDFVYVPPGGGQIAQRCLIESVQPLGKPTPTDYNSGYRRR